MCFEGTDGETVAAQNRLVYTSDCVIDSNSNNAMPPF